MRQLAYRQINVTASVLSGSSILDLGWSTTSPIRCCRLPALFSSRQVLLRATPSTLSLFLFSRPEMELARAVGTDLLKRTGRQELPDLHQPRSQFAFNPLARLPPSRSRSTRGWTRPKARPAHHAHQTTDKTHAVEVADLETILQEKGACGVGFITNLKNECTQDTLQGSVPHISN